MSENKVDFNTEWFREWFDSPYYHVLYSHRDEAEAKNFLDRLDTHLNLPLAASVLDLACGKGRHSVYLSSKGYDVHGIDLSIESIQYAKQFENDLLHFDVQDMRYFDLSKQFDCILNLFTSFGYFQNIEENLTVLKRIKTHLNKNGIFVLDYFNPKAICAKMAPEHQCKNSGVLFDIKKSIRDGQVIKEIQVTDGNKKEYFVERVQLLEFETMQSMLHAAGLTYVHAFGDYNLKVFQPESSERMIIIARN
jgi:SAM-dependent methyltransferase